MLRERCGSLTPAPGEFQLKDGVWKFVKIIDEHPDWTAIYALTDPAQRVWLVYTDRLVVIDGANKRTYSTPGRLTIGALNLVAARDEHLWVGGQSGLAFLKDDRFHTLLTNAADSCYFSCWRGWLIKCACANSRGR